MMPGCAGAAGPLCPSVSGPWWGGAGSRGGERGRGRYPPLLPCCRRLCPPATSLPEPPNGTAWERGTSRAAGHLPLAGFREICVVSMFGFYPRRDSSSSQRTAVFLVCTIKIREVHAEENSVVRNPVYVLWRTDSHFLRFLASHRHSILTYFSLSRQPYLSQIHPSCYSF